MTKAMPHQPVMLDVCLNGLHINPTGIYVDGTFGRGGHTKAILDRLDKTGKLYGFDWDPDAAIYGKKLALQDKRFNFVEQNFSNMHQVLNEAGHLGNISGILLDVGVSSPQLDNPARGFSFMRDGPLDMRMNPSISPNAAEWLAREAEINIAYVLKTYGGERFAWRIAKSICAVRQDVPLESTAQLAELISAAIPRSTWGKIHPATRSFQAIRIKINDELGNLGKVLPQTLDLLKISGRLVVLSFHSDEHIVVKKFIKFYSAGNEAVPRRPIAQTPKCIRLRRIGRVIKPSSDEVALNVRARSANCRIVEKVA